MSLKIVEDTEKPKKALKRKVEELGEELGYLQRKCRELGIPVLIVVEGWSAAGKGFLINRMIQPLDPRGFKVTCIASPNRDEQLRPFLWRFWRRTPSAERMAIFDRSWYRNLLDEVVDRNLSDPDLEKAYADIRSFERQLRDSGTVIFKFFLDISKKEQAQRLQALRENPNTSWRVDDGVLARHYKYDEYKKVSKQMFEETDVVDGAHWQVIDTTKFLPATVQILETLVNLLQSKVEKRKNGIKFIRNCPAAELPKFKDAPSLARVDTSLTLGKEDYKEKLCARQKRIHELQNELYRLRIPMVIVYEGWDAAGKGGNIRRLTEEMDPRGYEVIPISAPNDVEKVHHYLWRFWTEFPKAGHLTIFDRSWYGRVLVERVEGFCEENDWKQAYREINEMEENFHHFDSVIVKFWVHIDKDEQLRRFEARKGNPAKLWKLHDEDWRNREKWDSYQQAADEMFLRTHSNYAPWTIVEGNCKRYARIKAMDVVIDAIEKKIEKKVRAAK